MAVPDFQSLMLPVLRASAGGDIASADIRKIVAADFKLNAEDLAERQASGTQTKFYNRTAWAVFYLERAGLLDRVKKGVYRASGTGQDALHKNPDRIDVKYLQNYPKFVEWRQKNPIADDSGAVLSTASGEAQISLTPEEQMETSHQLLTAALAQQLVDKMREISPKAFEALVVKLLLALGYGGGLPEMAKLTGGPGDKGIDGVINQDALGLDVVCVQAKRYKEANTVGSPDVQQFAGSLQGVGASKGIFITTSSFSPAAHDFVKTIGNKIKLIDGQTLARLMIEKNVGVNVTTTYPLKQIDENYFSEPE